MRTPRAERNESGFTLTELLITISILGVITLAVSGALFTAMRTASSASNGLPGPQFVQNLRTYLAADIASAIPSTIDSTDTPSVTECGSTITSSGSDKNIVRFEAEDPASSPVVRFTVSYRWRNKSIWRTFCEKGQAPSHKAAIVDNVAARPLAALSVDKRTITIPVTTTSKGQPYVFTLRGAVRTPKDPAVPGPLVGTPPAIRTPCKYTSTFDPSIGRLGPGGAGASKPLNGTFEFWVKTNLASGSTCTDLWVTVECTSADCGTASTEFLRLTQLSVGSPVWSRTITCSPTPPVTPAEFTQFCGPLVKWNKSNGPAQYNVIVLDGFVSADEPGAQLDGPTYKLDVQP